ncbi:MAG TPA: electron transfer flavoprotein subunit beta/FixA family protein [Nitrolancea sp.]|nr:electron transfer flavoprotein subunit beta/FixA family protein [Nitrolancea sp.]
MLNIVVLVKQVPNPNGIRFDPRPEPVINEYDLHAVEAAIRIKERTGIAQVTVASLGPAKEALIRCLAMGADRAVLIESPPPATDSLATATLLAALLRREQFDLVLTGQETSDSGTGNVGPQLAGLLDLPVVSNVVEFDIEDGPLTLRRLTEDGQQDVQVNMPAVLCILSCPSEPRFPTLKGLLTARHKPIEHRTLANLGITAGDLAPAVTWDPPFADEEQSEGIILKGTDPETAAEELVTFLQKRKLI